MPASPVRISLLALVIAAVVAAPAAARQYPETIALPDGWGPEGIAAGFGNQFFAGSRLNGGIYRGNLKTGKGDVLVPGATGGAATGLKVDRRNRLFVSGAGTGTARVYKAGSGKLLREYALHATPRTFINDVTLTRRAAYFTDSVQQQLYVLELGRHGKLPAQAKTLPLKGDLQYDDDDEHVRAQRHRRRRPRAADHGAEPHRQAVPGQRPQRPHARDRPRRGLHAQRRRSCC